MKKILITGIDSFTGRYLFSFLKKFGYEVFGTSYSNVNNDFFKCDIRKKSDIKYILEKIQPDYIIHLAGISFPAHGHHEDFYSINTIGTTNILDTLLDIGMNPSKIILVSSAIVYGNQGLELLDELLCPKPTNHYGASKYVMETLSSNYFTKLNIILTRTFNYTGIGQAEHFLIPKIIKHFKEGQKTIELGNLNVIREFNDVSFVCEAYKKLLESDTNNAVVNVCSNRGIKLLDVIDMMNDIASYTIEVQVNPEFVRKDEIKSLTGSTQKLFNLIGEIKQKEFKETLREMFEA